MIHFLFWACVWTVIVLAAIGVSALLWHYTHPTTTGNHAAPFREDAPAVAAGTVPVAPTRSQPPVAAFPPLNRPAGETRPAPRRRPVLPAPSPRWASSFTPAGDTSYRQRDAIRLAIQLQCAKNEAEVEARFAGITDRAHETLLALTAGAS